MIKKIAGRLLDLAAIVIVVIMIVAGISAIQKFGWFWGILVCLGIITSLLFQCFVSVYWVAHMQKTVYEIEREQMNESDPNKN